MADLTWLQTLASGAAGGAITLAGQWLRGRQERGAQLHARAVDRADSKADRRDTFELEVLQALRPKITALMIQAYDTREVFDRAEAETGDGSVIFEDNGMPRYTEAYTAVKEDAPVVLDLATRSAVELYAEDVKNFANGALEYNPFYASTEAVQEALGARIRQLHGEPT